MESVNEIHILFDGYSFMDPEDNEIMRANCTCTLIKGKDNYNVIVDTMTPWDGHRITEALAKHNLSPKDIKAVVCTHGHSDHTGNNNLFLEAQWLFIGQSPSCKDKYFTYNFDKAPFKLTDDVSVIATPGHTLSCVSVLVKSSNLGKTVAICGDLFEKQEDIFDSSIWLSAGSENPCLQEEKRAMIAEMVDYIIPGHGTGFIVTPEIREKIKSSCEN